MKKIILTFTFISISFLIYSQKIWFTDVSYDCTYAFNSCNNVVVDTITFKFTVNYDNKNSINEERGLIMISFEYYTQFYTVSNDINFIFQFYDKEVLTLISDYNCRILSNKNKFICKVDIFDKNLPDIHDAVITKSYSTDELFYKYIDQKPIYFGKLKNRQYKNLDRVFYR